MRGSEAKQQFSRQYLGANDHFFWHGSRVSIAETLSTLTKAKARSATLGELS